MVCNLLAVIKFGLANSTRREPKDHCLLIGWHVYSKCHWLLGDDTFYSQAA